MDSFTRKALDKRQKTIGADMERHLASALRQLEGYSELLEKGYFLGGLGVSTLSAGHLYLSQSSRALANDWLRSQLEGLAAMISGGSPERVKISLSVEPRA